ncbi:MAG: hypothetical protein J6L89_08780 [Clostridia bacterium]|nr:hypothetical protein [Clostridia bacterium]
MSDEIDLFEEEIEKYRETYESVIDKSQDSDFVDELFESSDGTPIKNWSIEDINKLIEDVDNLPDIEQAGEDFDIDRYDEYHEPKKPEFSEQAKEEKEESYDEGAVYFSKEYEQDLAAKDKEINEIPTEFEDISSVSEDYQEADEPEEENEIETQEINESEASEVNEAEETTEDFSFIPEEEEENSFFDNSADEEFSSLEGNINDARADGEFREIDESTYDDGFGDNEVVYDGTFDRGDYLKIKDIFKNSQILSKRKVERAEVRENAMETVKEKYGEAIFEAKRNEGDFNDILRRQRAAEQEELQQQKNQGGEKRFDLESQEYVATPEVETKEIIPEENAEVREDDGLDETIFVRDLSAFEEVAKMSAKKLPEDEEQTKIITSDSDYNTDESTEDTQTYRNIFISPQHRRVNEDQLRFEGFPEDEEFLPDEVSDEEVKENLRKAREEKKNLFRMTSLPNDYDDIDPNYFSPEKGKYDEEEHLVLSDENDPKSFLTMFKKSFIQERDKKFTEYTTSNEKPQVFKELYDRRRRSIFGIIAMAVMALLFVSISSLLGSFELLTTEVQSACVAGLSLVSMLLTFVFGSCVTQPGIREISKGKFTFDSAVTVMVLVSCLTSIAMFFDLSGVAENYPVYTSAIIMCVIFNCIGRTVETSRVINALKTATTKRQDNLYTIQNIDDLNTAQNIGRVFAGEKPDLKYSCKTMFPSGFIFNSFVSNPADRFSRVFFPVFAILSLIVAIIAGIINEDVVLGFATFMATLLASFPMSLLFALNFSLSSVNKRLAKRRACITGYNAAANVEKTDAVVVDAIDLFDIDKCNFHGMKDYGTVRVDDIILYAAAMLTNSRGPLAHVFDKAIIGDKKELLPEVEDLCYEERLGLSGWIRGEKVFVGNRNLIINHNMEAPPKGAEVACLKEGKKVLYIAIDGQVAAMLVVEYAKNEEMKKHLGKLQKKGISIVVTTNDCNIDEEFLSLEYNMPRESFKVIGDFEGGLLDGYIHRLRKSSPAKLIHDGTSLSFFETFASAISYAGSVKLTFAIEVVMMLLGLIVTAVFAFTGNLSAFSSGLIILVQIIIAAIITAISAIRAKI